MGLKVSKLPKPASRTVPPLGALPYTETVGDTQYLRMLFVWGYGPLEISDLRIGETPLSEFEFSLCPEEYFSLMVLGLI